MKQILSFLFFLEVYLSAMNKIFLLAFLILLGAASGCSSSRKANCHCPPMGKNEISKSDFTLNKK
jgi:hypothetical protein